MEGAFDVINGRALLGILTIDYKLTCETGLLIRAPGAKMIIGGADVQPMSTKKIYEIDGQILEIEVPYIPGSSIKGRMRSLLEVVLGLDVYSRDRKIYIHVRDLSQDNWCWDPDCVVDNLFGSPSIHIVKLLEKRQSATDERKKIIDKFLEVLAPTRLIFSDAFPTIEYVKKLRDEKLAQGIDIIEFDDFLEEKSENRIDRITSAADPRTFLRVKPEVEFEGTISYFIYDVDVDQNKIGKLEDYVESIFRGMKLLEDTYLGGCGSRGYGRIKFSNIRLILKPRSYYIGGASGHHEIGTYVTLEDLLRKIKDITSELRRILEDELKKYRESKGITSGTGQ